jgi:hypothetical protein
MLIASCLHSAMSAYALEKYNTESAVISSILNTWREAGGFAVGYFQPSWISKVGVAGAFGTQAAILAAAAVVFLGSLFWLEHREAKMKKAARQQARYFVQDIENAA